LGEFKETGDTPVQPRQETLSPVPFFQLTSTLREEGYGESLNASLNGVSSPSF
jgi:hypothetical protein